MKLALLSDLHANRQALQACLDHARAQGAERLLFLGDLVGYGADPVAVLDQVMACVADGALAVQGNHDAMAVAPPAKVDQLGALSAGWTHAQLGPAHRQFLQQLPLSQRCGAALLVHASADGPARWHYVDRPAAAERSLDAALRSDAGLRYVFSGHVHAQALFFRSPSQRMTVFQPQPGVAVPVPPHRHWLATVGSCGQPRDGDARAMYALWDDTAHSLCFHRVPYDHAGAARAIRAAGLPSFFADRLERGQ